MDPHNIKGVHGQIVCEFPGCAGQSLKVCEQERKMLKPCVSMRRCVLISVVKGDIIGKSSLRKEHSGHSLIQRKVYVAIVWTVRCFF